MRGLFVHRTRGHLLLALDLDRFVAGAEEARVFPGNGWAPVPECIAGPEIFASAAETRRRMTNFEISSALLRNLSGLDQLNFEIWRRLAFAPPSRNAFRLSAAQIMACLAIFDHVRAVTSRLAGSFIHARWCHWLLFPSGPGGPLARVRCSPPRPHDPRR